MALPTDKDIKAARKSFRIMKREMKTLKGLLDTLSGKVEADDEDVAEAASNGNGVHVEGVAAQHDPNAHLNPQNPNIL